ncbi:MAG: hypothetical protein F6J87_23860, partial [Spirulina sp. SIO3F2]|nr:hypothetical protein [Spirulina sp. SIO3F2]
MTPPSPNSLKIRSLQLRDIEAIAQLVERTWGEAQATQWQRLSHPNPHAHTHLRVSHPIPLRPTPTPWDMGRNPTPQRAPKVRR